MLDAAESKGRSVPDWANTYEWGTIDGDFYLDSFWDLNTERRYDCGPIPHSTVVKYCTDKDIPYPLSYIFRLIVDSLDKAYLTWIGKEREKASKPTSNKS